MKRIKLFITAVMLGCTPTADAQNISDWIKGFNPQKVSYDYEAFLIDNKTNGVLDKVQGKIYVFRNQYLDSNGYQINAFDGSRSLQIDLNARRVFLKSFKKMQPDASARNVLFDLNTIVKEKIKDVGSEKNAKGETVITIQLIESYLQEVKVVLNESQHLKQLKFKMLSDGGAAMRVLVMNAFTESFDPSATSLKRFFSGGSYTALRAPYSDFEFKNITL